jgi:hypothetical protein
MKEEATEGRGLDDHSIDIVEDLLHPNEKSKRALINVGRNQTKQRKEGKAIRYVPAIRHHPKSRPDEPAEEGVPQGARAIPGGTCRCARGTSHNSYTVLAQTGCQPVTGRQGTERGTAVWLLSACSLRQEVMSRRTEGRLGTFRI